MIAVTEALVLGVCRNVLCCAEAPLGADAQSQDILDSEVLFPV